MKSWWNTGSVRPDDDEVRMAEQTALAACQALGGRDGGRLDLRSDRAGCPAVHGGQSAGRTASLALGPADAGHGRGYPVCRIDRPDCGIRTQSEWSFHEDRGASQRRVDRHLALRPRCIEPARRGDCGTASPRSRGRGVELHAGPVRSRKGCWKPSGRMSCSTWWSRWAAPIAWGPRHLCCSTRSNCPTRACRHGRC